MPDFSNVKSADLISKFVTLRDARKQSKAEFDERDKRVVEMLDAMTATILSRMNEEEVTSIKSKAGTAFVHESTKVQCDDWDAFYSHMEETKNFDLLQKRLGSRAVQQYVEDKGTPPPGVKLFTEREVRVRTS